jgi:FKBP-type peptidyl-prolyl cis-trans isomerase
MHKKVVSSALCLALVGGIGACKKAEQKPEPQPVAESPEPAAPAPEEPKGLPAPPDVKAPPEDAEKTASGLASKVLKPGTGAVKPSESDAVKVHYSGWTTDGNMFDSSVVRGEPAQFPLQGVIKGWTEGLQLMVEGEQRRFWIPADLAYGDPPTRPGAPAGMLVFDVELLAITKAPETPKDVKGPPKAAKKTKSGLAYMVLKKGSGTDRPKAENVVEVHYTGWTTDGRIFDSSVMRNESAVFPLNGVIPGWTEGVQLMAVGEKARFWIPGSLAYGDQPMQPGAPAGMLVFDIELLGIRQ